MKENGFNQIKMISEVEFPSELHGRIMRSLYLSQFRVPLLVINALLFFNFLVSGWEIWSTVRTDAVSAAEPYLANFARVAHLVPLTSFFALLFNLSLLAVSLYALYKLRILLGELSRRPSRKVLN